MSRRRAKAPDPGPGMNENVVIQVTEAFTEEKKRKELAFSNVDVTLNSGPAILTKTTGEKGKAGFENVPPGNYKLKFKINKTSKRDGKDDNHVEESQDDVETIWIERAMTDDNEDVLTEVDLTVKSGTTTRMRLVVKDSPMPDNWAFSDGTEQKAASEMTYDSCLEKLYMVLKLLTMFLVFLLTLASAVVAKGSTFFILSQLSDRPLTVCGVFHDPTPTTPTTPTTTTTPTTSTIPTTTGADNTYVTNTYNTYNTYDIGQVTNTPMEKVAWLWCIFFAFTIPEVLRFLKSLNSCLSRNVGLVQFLSRCLNPSFLISFLSAAMLEVGHVLGAGILFFHALPKLDSLTAIMMTSGVCLFPNLLKIVGDFRNRAWIKLIVSVFAIIMLTVGLVLLPLMVTDGQADPWAAPVGLVLISLGWWQNFVGKKTRRFGWLHSVKEVVNVNIDQKKKSNRDNEDDGDDNDDDKEKKDKNVKTGFFVGMILAIWKILLFFGCVSIIPCLSGIVPSYNYIFYNFQSSFEVSDHLIVGPNGPILKRRSYENFMETPWFVLMIQLLSTLLAYMSGRFACKLGDIKIRLGPCLDSGKTFSFAAPGLALVTPMSIAILVSFCHLRSLYPCSYTRFPTYLFFSCPAQPLDSPWPWVVGGLMFLSYLWVTSHTWTAHSRVLASEVQIFGVNYYNGLLVDQAMMLCRRRSEDDEDEEESISSTTFDEESNMNVTTKHAKKLDNTIRIKGCATMWHENSEEIKVMLKSVFRIDDDYYARKKALNLLPLADQKGKALPDLMTIQRDYVDFFEWETHIFFDDCMNKKGDNVNSFVIDLIGAVDEYGKQWFGNRGVDGHKMKLPDLVKYITPYGGRLVWTLPGGTTMTCHLKDKTKIRHKKRWSQIMYMYYFLGYQLKGDTSLKTDEERDNRAKNTFLLALDGDVDFLPDAIVKVVDLMKRNDRIGAACGRIHPTGSGYMQQYQKFEYAIGHWLQKATEHMLGCVLCSPGCFSLFRAAAVMDTNVMHTYKSLAKEPKHHVQYDQGEDRWLCTLMLKQGWRVEYSAASDSFTACPEGFKEFYNQRRRWMPSTLLNIADLIGDYKQVVEKNDDISLMYILYQSIMMVGTIVGPGSIILILVGAFTVAFGITNDEALIINAVLVGSFIVTCIFAKADNQIRFAELLTVLYAIIMIAVYIGVALTIIDTGPLSLTALGIWVTFGSQLVAAMLHPQEFGCFFSVLIYLCTIPSMYLLLVIYAFFNMDNQGWGTREGPKVASVAETPKVTPGDLMAFAKGWLTNKIKPSEGGKASEAAIEEPPKGPVQLDMEAKKEESKPKAVVLPDDDGFVLDDGKAKPFDRHEEVFWRKMIDTTDYLKPLSHTDEEKKEIAQGLFELKNKYALSFVMVNAIFIAAIYMLQANQDKLNVPWPLGAMVHSITWNTAVGEDRSKISIEVEFLKMEPIGAMFMVAFILIMFIQFIGMIQHRLMTLSHIVATTSKTFKVNDKNLENRGLTRADEKFLERVDKELQRNAGTSVHGDSNNRDPSKKARKPWKRTKQTEPAGHEITVSQFPSYPSSDL